MARPLAVCPRGAPLAAEAVARWDHLEGKTSENNVLEADDGSAAAVIAMTGDFDPGWHLRPMRVSDCDAVMASERATYEFPWAAEVFEECLRVGYNCWVAELGRVVVAHGVMSIGADECHILNLCVHPQWQRLGLGRRLLRRLLGLARTHGADTAFLEVRISNDPARGLYAAEGFCEIGTRRGYYPARNGREDAVVLALAL